MTLIFERSSENPQTHALIIGVGNFPYLNAENTDLIEDLRDVDNVTSPPNNARAISEWLIEAADRLVPKLGTIELLISETDGSPATFPLGEHTPPGRNNDTIEAATGDNVARALRDWVTRSQSSPDNLALFYGSSHGMQAQEHVLLLEDAGEDPNDPWRNMISLNHLHRNLYKKENRRSVLFADCCRDLLEEGANALDGFTGRRIGTITEKEYVHARSEPDRFVYVLRASPLGAVASATSNGLGHFTESLLTCFRGGAGENKPVYGWSISPAMLRRWVEHAGRYGLGFADTRLRPHDEDSNWDDLPILKLTEKPKYPVRVREAEAIDVGRATLTLSQQSTAYREQRAPSFGDPPALYAWVPPSMDNYKASGIIAGTAGEPDLVLISVDVPVLTTGHDVPLRRNTP